MSIFRSFFGGGNDRSRYGYDLEDDQDFASDTAAPQFIRYRGHGSYPTMAGPQSVPPHMGSTLDPLVDYRDPPQVMEPRVVVEPRMKPMPRVVQEVRANQAHAVPLVREQIAPVVNHVHRVLEFRVPLCCEGCQDRIVKHFRHVRGVENVSCDLNRHKVTVHGYAPPHEVLRIMRKQFPRAEFWTPEPIVIVQKAQGPTPRKVTVVEPPGVRHTPVNVIDETGARHPEVAVEHVHRMPAPRPGIRVH